MIEHKKRADKNNGWNKVTKLKVLQVHLRQLTRCY